MAARLVASGLGRPDAPVVYDVGYATVPDWLAARRLLAPDWHAVGAASAAAVAAAAPALPPDLVEGAAAAGSTQPWTYGAASALLNALSQSDSVPRGLLGGLAGPAGAVEAAVLAWEKSGAAAAGAGLALAAAVDCEIPALKKAVARGHQAVTDLDRRAADSRRAAAAAAAAHADRCARAGLAPGVPVRAGLAALPARELPAVLAGLARELRSPGVGEAMALYAGFTAAMHGGGGGPGGGPPPTLTPSAMLPALAALRAADLEGDGSLGGDGDAFWGGGGSGDGGDGERDQPAAAPPADDPDPDADDGDGGDDDDGGAAAWGITTLAGGAGGPGAGPGPGRAGCCSRSAPSYLAALADSPPARAALGDDVAELAAFLGARAADAGSPAAAAAAAARCAPALPAAADLDRWTAHLAAAAAALASDRTALLLSLRAGGRAADRAAADLEAGARAEARHREAAACAAARGAAARAGLVQDAAALTAAIARARALKADAEAAASARLGKGRRVVLVGPELDAVLAIKASHISSITVAAPWPRGLTACLVVALAATVVAPPGLWRVAASGAALAAAAALASSPSRQCLEVGAVIVLRTVTRGGWTAHADALPAADVAGVFVHETVSPYAVQAAVAMVAAGRGRGLVLALGDCAAPRPALKLAVGAVREAAARARERGKAGWARGCEPTHTLTRPRREFGRAVTLEASPPAVLWDARPDEEAAAAFAAARGGGGGRGGHAPPSTSSTTVAVQAEPAMAAHAVSTEAPATVAAGVQHGDGDGGWPEGVDGGSDADAAARFRRRAEAAPAFLPGLRAAAGVLEAAVRAAAALPVFEDALGRVEAGWSPGPRCGGGGVAALPAAPAPAPTPAVAPLPPSAAAAAAAAALDSSPASSDGLALLRIAGLRPPGPAARTPVSAVAWSPDGSAKLLVSHAPLAYVSPSEGAQPSPTPPPSAFWWDAARPAAGPVASFAPPHGCGAGAPGIASVAPAPREAGLFVAGLTDGRVALYDPRTPGSAPVAVSPTDASTHGGTYVAAIVWPAGKAGGEVAAAGADGVARWWDARALGRGPADAADLAPPPPRQPGGGGAPPPPPPPPPIPSPATALLCPAAGTARLLVGTAAGSVLPVLRAARPPAPRVGAPLATHAGPVAGLAPAHPALARAYLVAAEWAPRVWSEDARSALAIAPEPPAGWWGGGGGGGGGGARAAAPPRPRCTAARWSATRPAIVFSGGDDGVVRAYDLRARGGGGGGGGGDGGDGDAPAAPPAPWLAATGRPVAPGGVSALAARGCGRLLAVGSAGQDGAAAGVALLEVSGALASPHPAERAEVAAFLEREAGRLRAAADRAARDARAARGGGGLGGAAATAAPSTLRAALGPSPAELAEYERRFLEEAGLLA